MGKKIKRNGFISNFKTLIMIGLALLLPLVVFIINKTGTYNRSDASYTSNDFLQAQGKDLVFRGVKVTLRGVNFDNISALGADIGGDNIDAIFTKEEDYKKLAEFGGNHARFGMSHSWYLKDKAKFFSVMDQHVKWAHDNGIWLTLLSFTNPDGDNGCYEGYGNSCSMWTNATYQKQLLDFWLEVAARYKDEPAVAGYDLVNEPTPPGPGWCKTWFDMAQNWRNQVAAVAPNQLVFIEACSDPTFDRVFKENDGKTKAKNVVYEVHDYDPMGITHPGYDGKKISTTYPGNASAWVDGVQKNLMFDKSTFEGTRYPDYSTAKIYSIDWAKQNDVPIYVGEWGAQGWTPGYVQYIKDKAEIYNKLGVNHAYYTWKHDVKGGWRWGVFDRAATNYTSPDPEKLEAMKMSLTGSFRPSFGTAGTQPSSSPVVTMVPMPTPVATVIPLPPSPVSTPRPTASPLGTPRPLPSPVVSIKPVPTVIMTPKPTPVVTKAPSPSPNVPSPSPVSQNNTVTGYVDIYEDWDSGYCARLVVKNQSTKNTKAWTMSFKLNQAKINTKWNASFLNLLGNITVTPNKDNKYLPAGGTNDYVDYCAKKTGSNWRPSNISVKATFE